VSVVNSAPQSIFTNGECDWSLGCPQKYRCSKEIWANRGSLDVALNMA